MKRLPLGLSKFDYLRQKELYFIYVDKTEHIYRMLETGQVYFFLSRPRRFGKTLLVSTLKMLFQGRKELFKGLYIEDKWDFEPHPVIHIGFGGGNFHSDRTFNNWLREQLRKNEEDLGLPLSSDEDVATRFYQLIRYANEKYKQRVVVLIDEYDKPLLDVLTDKGQLERNRQTLRGVYSVLKEADSYLRFVFLTGVSKFSQVSIFSGLNNLNDLSFHAHYASICGYTQAELEEHFAEYLVNVDIDEMKLWYDGYNFMAQDKRDHVYAPYDVLLYFYRVPREFESYWFNTGTSDFLVNVLKERNETISLMELEDVLIEKSLLSVNEINRMPLAALLFQTGYLTMLEQNSVTPRKYLRVGIPNYSVRIALANQLVQAIAGIIETMPWGADGYRALYTGDLHMIEEHWNVLFSRISYDNTRMKTLEAFYRNHAFTYCHMLEVDVRMEEHTSRGRIDMSIRIGDRAYVCEFKKVGSGNPLQQIREKGYAEIFQGEQYKHITLVGVLCNPEPDKEKGEQVVKLVWEEM